MKRRGLILAAGALGVFAPVAALAQRAGKLPVVGYVFGTLHSADMQGADPVHAHPRAFVHRLRDLGWEDGKTFVLERHGAENRRDRAKAIFADLVARKVDVLCATATVEGRPLALDAIDATRTIPIIFVGSSDPVAHGLVKSLARPGGNVTGVAVAVGLDFHAKRLQLLKEIVPGLKRIVLFGAGFDVQAMLREAAVRLGLTLVPVEVTRNEQLDEALATVVRERPGAILVSSAGFAAGSANRIVTFAAQHRIPAGYFFAELVEAGGLMSYAVNILDINRRGAEYVDRILRGAKPADLPVELPSKFELVINLKTAKALGITIPQSVLLRADRVIE